MSKFYLCTAIAYVNAPPHIGHALEFIQADALCRYHRLKGDDTFFLTGTDEHGVKIYEASQKAGVSTQEFVDKNAEIFQSLKGLLDLSNDGFIRTSDDAHKKAVQKLWLRLDEAGDIYKGVYKGNYCVGCEAFIPEKDLDEEGNCPIHKRKPDLLEEENYFFRLSKYSEQIKDLISRDELLILPESRKKEMLNIIGEEGLRDVSFSRPKAVLPWGIDVPGDDAQVMYVWADALSNYITGIGYGSDDVMFEKYWPCDVQLIGKDILRFHAGIWIGMLISAGIEIPKAIYVHGFVTSEGQKMSKSLGNVVDPLEYIEKYGKDALRYFLLREIPTVDDGDFSHKRFVEIFNSELANNLGNLVNRVVMMTEKYADGKVPKKASGLEFGKFVEDYKKAFEGFDIKRVCEVIISLVDFGNKYIDDKKPWVMAKEENGELPGVLYNLLELLRFMGVLLVPVLPGTAEKILGQIDLDLSKINLDLKWGELEEGLLVRKADALFPRLEE